MKLSKIPSPRKIYPLVCLTMALALMVFPFGVAMTFAPGPDDLRTATYAYFSLMPAAYGNFLPLLAGVLTLAATALFLLTERFPLKRPAWICLLASIVCSPLSWLIFGAYTQAGLAVVIFQLLALALILLTRDTPPDGNQ